MPVRKQKNQAKLSVCALYFYTSFTTMNPETTISRYFWSFVVLALVMMADQTEGWRRRRRRRCPVRSCAVSPFTGWSSCSQPCGTGGTKTRTRTVTRGPTCGGSPCPPLRETRRCYIGCPNGGIPLPGRCSCKTGYSGRCCTGGILHRSFGIPL